MQKSAQSQVLLYVTTAGTPLTKQASDQAGIRLMRRLMRSRETRFPADTSQGPLNTMNLLAELRGATGNVTLVGYDFRSSFESLAVRGEVDCFVVSTEDGFSPLGSARRFFSHDLGIDEKQISEVANWNRFENQSTSLVVLRPRASGGKLRGVILAASGTSRCYEKVASKRRVEPDRTFYYSVAFESIAFAARQLKAKRLAMSHLSGSGQFHEDIATCTAEALGHFCDLPGEPRLESFSFVGCCIDPSHLRGMQRLNAEGGNSRHRPIPTNTVTKDGHSVISLDIGRGARQFMP